FGCTSTGCNSTGGTSFGCTSTGCNSTGGTVIGTTMGGSTADAGSARGAGAGQGGDSEVDCTTSRPFGQCTGSCNKTVAEYCEKYTSCDLTPEERCQRIWFGATWQRGCGYISAEYRGDVGDSGMDIWEESTGKLVYHWFNGNLSVGCVPQTIVGEKPSCAEWAPACPIDEGS
ncbi:MAG TPA: hypothetical protein VFQ61_24165, partial [Polyangiaceae bacterium]|nr:hypothetical protein [Polyangiaceae bacterium]